MLHSATTPVSAEPIRCSATHARYFQCGDTTWIPVGANLCFPRFYNSPEDGLATLRRYLDALADNGGNYTRLFLGHPLFDIEANGLGCFDTGKAQQLRALLDHAHARGIRVKLTLELFRTIDPQPQAEVFPGALNFSRPLYHTANGGKFDTLDEYLQSEAGHRHFLAKLDWLIERLGDHPAAFGWELWNEMNALRSPHWPAWTDAMLPELKRRLPQRLVMQNLGSFDRDDKRVPYDRIMPLPSNDIAQVHRYLDFGAPWTICQGPVDMMMADAITELRRIAPGKPVLLSEGGAVEPNHARPWDLYAKDRDGIVMHDVLFAPFFAGSAGSGQPWHWHEYIDRNDLWWHFRRFTRAIEGIDPVREAFTPARQDTQRLRVYALRGKDTSLLWCRDTACDWQTELRDGTPPAPVTGETLKLPHGNGSAPPTVLDVYDPWTDAWTSTSPSNDTIALPTFTRSLVIRVRH
ncbi:MAG: hypothetical protein Q7Q73_19125 [Verrucomicrobiota bacterium JB024]|nr:hypothetical protein [Verrucomicrobiota bacterium JB024]